MNSTVLNTKFGDIEYCLIGNGIPVIFIHGGHSNCHEKLCHKGFDLKKYKLITISRPGYGKTPLNNNKTPKKAADLIVELLTYLSIDNIIVYGISAGGLTAIELVANYPDKINKLILASAISKKWLNKNEKTYKTAKKIFHPKIGRIIWGMIRAFSKILPNVIARSFYPQFSKYPSHRLKKEDVEELISSMKYYNSKFGFLNDIVQNISSEIITKIKCPTLIVHSENDNSVSLEHALNANKMIENSKIRIIQNEWGHLFWIGSDSKKTINNIINFIEE